MKNRKPILSLLATACVLVMASTSYAATCNNTQGSIAAPPATPATVQGNTCGHNLNYSGSSALCGGTSFSTTGTDVYQLTIGNSAGLKATVASPGTGAALFIPDIAVVSATCADNATCVNDSGLDQEGATGGASSSATATVADGQGVGANGTTYFLIITDSTAAGAQCGSYTLSFQGTLPVKLQDFSVQ